jgi:hypothetical protein
MSSGYGYPVLIGEGGVVQECSVDHIGQPSFKAGMACLVVSPASLRCCRKARVLACQWVWVRAIRWIAQLS